MCCTVPICVKSSGDAFQHDDTGMSFEMEIGDDPVLVGIDNRVALALGYRNRIGGTFRFRHYLTGESHPPHFDAYTISGSHLVATALICLQAPEKGGETTFPKAHPPVALLPRSRRLALWLNYLENGKPDPASYHAGEAVTEGDKITLTAFVYGSPPGTPAIDHGLVPLHDIEGVRLAPDEAP